MKESAELSRDCLMRGEKAETGERCPHGSMLLQVHESAASAAWARRYWLSRDT